jgi:hypothetical protein
LNRVSRRLLGSIVCSFVLLGHQGCKQDAETENTESRKSNKSAKTGAEASKGVRYLQGAKELSAKACSCRDKQCYEEWKSQYTKYIKMTQSDIESLPANRLEAINKEINKMKGCIDPLETRIVMEGK